MTLKCFFPFPFQAQQLQQEGVNNQWLSNNNRLFSDFSSGPSAPGSGAGLDWSLGLVPAQQPLYGSMAQQ